MSTHAINNVVVIGGGLAGSLCTLALVKNLPDSVNITWVETEGAPSTDILYGTVAPPSFYGLFLKTGVSEPDLLLNTGASLSYGTEYKNWGLSDRNWVQSYSKALPNINGIAFHHLVRRSLDSESNRLSLDPYLMASTASLKGVFAHPRSDHNSPLSTAEYGFNYHPDNWSKYLTDIALLQDIQHINSQVAEFKRDENTVKSVSLENGQTLSGDFFIDCRAHSKIKANASLADWVSGRTVKVETYYENSKQAETGSRIVNSDENGWVSRTPLQNQTITVRLSSSDATLTEAEASNSPSTDSLITQAELGRLKMPWVGNLVSLGHAASVIEPLTPAPLMMLQADIERLLDLFPVTNGMDVESREYNRRFHDDLTHKNMFQQNFFKTSDLPKTPYWLAASSEPTDEKLSVKIEQFENRGVVVRYDYEAFEEQDWITLHFGLGRIPKRYDPLTDKIDLHSIDTILNDTKSAISEITKKIPPHSIYMNRFLDYLRKKYV
jgi:tryptophan halogenase